MWIACRRPSGSLLLEIFVIIYGHKCFYGHKYFYGHKLLVDFPAYFVLNCFAAVI